LSARAACSTNSIYFLGFTCPRLLTQRTRPSRAATPPTCEPTRRLRLPLLRPLPTDSLRSRALAIPLPPDLATLVLFSTDLMCLLWCPAGKEEEAKDVAPEVWAPRGTVPSASSRGSGAPTIAARVHTLLSLSHRRGAGALVSLWLLDSLSMM
jgi:hypothetical protein